MKPKVNFIVKSPIWLWRKFRIVRSGKKHIKDRNKTSIQYRNDYIVKRAEKFFNDFNIELKVFGYENIPEKGSTLIVPNHADNSDGFAIILALRKKGFDKNVYNKIPTFLAKNEIKSDKLARGVMDLIDSFYIDRENIRQSFNVINDLISFSKDNKTYPVVFPAGTRSRNNTTGEFKSTAFKIAKKGFFNIIPVTINNSLNAFDTNRKEKLIIEVYFHKLIKASEIVNLSPESISERVQKIINSKFKKPQITEKIENFWIKEAEKDKKYKEKLLKITLKEKQKEKKQSDKEEKLIKKLAEKEKNQSEKEFAKEELLKQKIIEKEEGKKKENE